MERIYNISLSSNKESNEFLRCLWSRIRLNYGKLAWNLTPLKIGKKKYILFGNADFGLNLKSYEPIALSCTYSSKGCLKSLKWTNSSLENPKEFSEKFQLCINEALNYTQYKKKSFLTFPLEKEVLFASFLGKFFSLDKNKVTFQIMGYDRVDCESFATISAKMIKDFISFDVLKAIGSKNGGTEYLHFTKSRKYSFVNIDTNENFFHNTDDELKYFELSNQMGEYIDLFLERDFDYENAYNNFEKSVSLFSQALFFEEMNHSMFQLDISASEYATICYMSALEVITIDDVIPQSCKECGQNRYSIAKRVKKLAADATNNDYLTSVVSNFYSSRSKFVHAGEYLSINSYRGSSLPLLSINSENGVINQMFNFGASTKELMKMCILWHEKNVGITSSGVLPDDSSSDNEGVIKRILLWLKNKRSHLMA